MAYYVGLDVSLRSVAICVIDANRNVFLIVRWLARLKTLRIV